MKFLLNRSRKIRSSNGSQVVLLGSVFPMARLDPTLISTRPRHEVSQDGFSLLLVC